MTETTNTGVGGGLGRRCLLDRNSTLQKPTSLAEAGAIATILYKMKIAALESETL
jgi:hypothetical protein